MEILAMKFLTFVYNSAAKISSYISIGILALGIILGTSACNRENIATVQHGVEELASSPTDLKVEHIKPENPRASKTLSNSNSPDSARTLAAAPKTQNLQLSVKQKEYGQLRLVNDTPYASVVYIYASAGESYRYAYVPPCATRELYDTYSNSGLIRLNGDTKFPIAQKAKREGDFLAIKMSTLVDDSKQEQLCKFKPYEFSNIGPLKFPSLPRLPQFLAFLDNGVNAPNRLGNIFKNKYDDLLNLFENFKPNNYGKTIQAFESFIDEGEKLADVFRHNQNNADVAKIFQNAQETADVFAMRAFGAQDDNQAFKSLVSHARLEFEAGNIKSETELKNFFSVRITDPSCAGLYSGLIFKDEAVEFIFKIFTLAKKLTDKPISNDSPPSGKLAQFKNTPAFRQINLALGTALNPECTSTRNNNPVFTLISDHSRPRFQKVLR